MDAGLKQRLVGAVVLVALAVIFLPMLLDGSGAREQRNQDIQIPDKPEAPESQLDQPAAGADAAVGDGSGATANLDDTPKTSESGSTTASAGATEPADTTTADSGSNADSGSDAEGGSSAGGEAGESTDASASADETPEQQDDAEGGSQASGWVVQVGSFGRETNALVLRDKLRESGFDSLTERVQSDGRTLWRVLVGPVDERSDGEALQRRIEEQRDGDTLLMSYP